MPLLLISPALCGLLLISRSTHLMDFGTSHFKFNKCLNFNVTEPTSAAFVAKLSASQAICLADNPNFSYYKIEYNDMKLNSCHRGPYGFFLYVLKRSEP
jgi:hypothetical protein